MKRIISMVIFSALICLSHPGLAKNNEQLIRDAVANEYRDPANSQRDQYRHPVEVLSFFGLKSDVTIVEIWPSSGWWTEILGPYTRPHGIYYAAGFAMTADRTPGWRKQVQIDFTKKLEANPAAYDHIIVTELSVPERTTIAPPNSADRVLTFRNVHNWMKGDYADAMFTTMYRALKPNGILGVVEHRAKPGTSLEDMKLSGYVTEDYIIKLANQAGFVLDAKSEINANPKDSAHHPVGVWTLPPSLRYCKKLNEDKQTSCFEQYRKIGESDRMTLRFIKK